MIIRCVMYLCTVGLDRQIIGCVGGNCLVATVCSCCRSSGGQHTFIRQSGVSAGIGIVRCRGRGCGQGGFGRPLPGLRLATIDPAHVFHLLLSGYEGKVNAVDIHARLAPRAQQSDHHGGEDEQARMQADGQQKGVFEVYRRRHASSPCNCLQIIPLAGESCSFCRSRTAGTRPAGRLVPFASAAILLRTDVVFVSGVEWQNCNEQFLPWCMTMRGQRITVKGCVTLPPP